MTSAIEYWKNRVEAHHAQSIRAQNESCWPSGDFWSSLAASFREDPHRTDDPVLDRLIQVVGPNTTVLDVGGGAGRYSLPLALRCGQVTVVDSSESMLAELRDGASAANIDNLRIVQGLWEDVSIEPSDLVLCAHVVYGIVEIEPFIRKLERHARERVTILLFTESPLSHTAPLWERVHGEERVGMPALPQILNVLWEMGIYPDLQMLEPTGLGPADNWDDAREFLRRVLYLRPDTEEDERLQVAMRELLVQSSDGVRLQGSRAARQGLISWSPE